MKDFEYLEPATLQEACSLLAQYGEDAKPLAGGMALVTLMKQKLISPRYLVSLEKVKGLDLIEPDGSGGLRIGALVTHRMVERSPLIAERYPVYAKASGHVGSVQVRNIGTLGGNLCHADPASDPPAILMALNARARVAGPAGERIFPLEELFVDYYEVALGPGEVLAEVIVPPLPPGARGTYIKFNPRTIMDLPLVGVAAFGVVEGPDGLVRDLTIGLAGVAPKPFRAHRAEGVLLGHPLKEEGVREAARAAAQDSDPVSDVRGSAEYRREMVEVLTARALRQLRDAGR